ncbi:type II toxin-antitoxin system VapC family toxin [Synechocystis sp. PCC 7338]|uniref:type II toxin-antitoxin system VapC family toxin n=1 Tax=Synechocystis sp. PCC 7338 TaxID=2732530 RepID=UPI001BAFF5C0|nr:type II toxin-antitoxin system VapC family toxin [Synechocystis sp. PCC 7338]QUS59307.1 type II toxin-antitoxin system VapC family toxin [Synechocystis sp. PCC 7338]
MIVLDTHIWLWWVNGDLNQLGIKRVELLQQTIPLAVSAISCFEIAWLDQHQRIILPQNKTDWFDQALEGSNILLLPIIPKIAQIAVELPEHHRDPHDRLIIATAIFYDTYLMSAE